jgi:hypothetical protein
MKLCKGKWNYSVRGYPFTTVSSVSLDPQADFLTFFSPPKKNTDIPTIMDRTLEQIYVTL